MVAATLQALLEALAKGEALAPAPAPAKIDPTSGAVRIPQKWDAKIRHALQVGLLMLNLCWAKGGLCKGRDVHRSVGLVRVGAEQARH